MKVNMQKKTVTVYSHFRMTPVIFEGEVPEMQMSAGAFNNMFVKGDWTLNWLECTDYINEWVEKIKKENESE